MRNSVEKKNMGLRWKFNSRLEDLDFANYIVLIASKFQDIQLKTKRVKDWPAKVGLKINEKKTKTMKIKAKVHEKIQIDNKLIEDVDDFTYLCKWWNS